MTLSPHRALTWNLVTGEYPPAAGGVGDYVACLARALSETGDRVCVLTDQPEARGSGGIELVRVAGLTRSPLGSLRLERRLSETGVVLLQYTPHAFGLRGANMAFAAWGRWSRRAPWVMFHEVHLPRMPGSSLPRRALALVQQRMAGMLARGASRVFISTEAWRPVLQRLAPEAPVPVWLPVPSNLPEQVSETSVSTARAGIAGPEAPLLGHFGTYSPWLRQQVETITFPLLLRDRRRHLVLIGRGSHEARGDLLTQMPELAARLHARAGPAPEVAAALAACDLVLQLYPDGPTTRRGTLMAALALGRAVVTNDGPLTEPAFRGVSWLRIARDLSQVGPEAEALLADPTARAAQGREAEGVYRARFAWARLVERLREEASTCA